MSYIPKPGSDGSGSGTSDTPEQIKTKYESNPDTNAFTDADKTAVDNLGELSEVDFPPDDGQVYGIQDETLVPITPSSGSETAATIKTKYESNPDTNAFTDADKTAINNLGELSEVDFPPKDGQLYAIQDEILVAIPPTSSSETAETIKTKYESNADTNAFTDADKNKLDSLSDTVSWGDIQGDINNQSDLKTKLDSKVDVETGKGLSEEDFTTAEKDKLASLEDSHFKGQYPNLSTLQSSVATPEAGDYAFVDTSTGTDVEVYYWNPNTSSWESQVGNTTAETPTSIKTKYESNPDTNAFTDSYKNTIDNLGDFANVDYPPNDGQIYGIQDDSLVVIPAGTSSDTPEQIKTKYESNANTNAFTDSDKTAIDNLGEMANDDYPNNDGVMYCIQDKLFVPLPATSSTETAETIKTKYESNADTNAFTDADKTAVDNLGELSEVDFPPKDGQLYAIQDETLVVIPPASSTETAETIKTKYESNPDTNAFTDSDKNAINNLGELSEVDYPPKDGQVYGIQDETLVVIPPASSTETAETIKTKYESNADTNAFTDADKTAVDNLGELSEVDFPPKDGQLYAIQDETLVAIPSGVVETAETIKTKYESNADTNAFTDADKSKLDSLGDAVEWGDIQGDLANQTDLNTILDNKVDIEAGKGLSEEDFTTAEKDKLAGLEDSHFKGQYPNLSTLQSSVVSPEAGDYAYVDAASGTDVKVHYWNPNTTTWEEQAGETTAETPVSIKTKYESNPDTNAFTDDNKNAVNNLKSMSTIALPSNKTLLYGMQNDIWVEIPLSGSSSDAGVKTNGRTAIGQNAGIVNQGYKASTFGNFSANKDQGDYSCAFGTDSAKTSQGSYAAAFGYTSGTYQQGDRTSAFGTSAGNNTQGLGACAFGYYSGRTTQQNYACSFGYYAGYMNQGQYALAFGWNSGKTDQATYAVAIGASAGETGQGQNAIAIGQNAGKDNQPIGSIAIGLSTTPVSQDEIVIGNSASSVRIGDGNVQSVSDMRDKYDIRDLDAGLKFINALSPKWYKYDIRELYEEQREIKDESGEVIGYKTIKHEPDRSKAGKRDHAGLIAQDVKATLDDFGIDFALFRDTSIGATAEHKDRAKDKLALCYQELIPVLIKSVQELSSIVDKQQEQINSLLQS